MRVIKIELRGYARFANASCNVDGEVIAFIGPNEAGKSSLLSALNWLTDAENAALTPQVRNRISPPNEGYGTVIGTYLIDQSDVDTISALDIDPTTGIDSFVPGKFELHRLPNGSIRTRYTPQLTRNLQPFADAHRRVEESVSISLEGAIDPEYETEVTDVRNITSATLSFLDTEQPDWVLPDAQVLRDFVARLREIPVAVSAFVGLQDALDFVELAADAAAKDDPDAAVRRALQKRVPKFVLFGQRHRNLPSAIDVRQPDLPEAFRNLLHIANTTAEQIVTAIDSGQSSMRSLEKRVNDRLAKRISAFWSQSDLTPSITINNTGVVEVNIDDAEGEGQVTDIGERSDGLQAFLALVCFLLATHSDQEDPILLIDEAERNLHYDAQGDLVRLLTNELPVRQVIYTTHSPGCLPLDLGTGIRVVRRDDGDPRLSVLENSFWTEELPGFSRLLVAMGAEAAAFSAFSKAVLTEGVSEMMLLPSLLRSAVPGRKIDFQVAFGLSNMTASKDLGSVALRTAFLVDGDASGDKKNRDLKRLGVPDSHLLQLPPGAAIEDLIERSYYLDVVDELIRESGGNELVERDLLDRTKTIAKSVDLRARSNKRFKPPGHKLVAARIGANPNDLKLSPLGKETLPKIWDDLDLALSMTYRLG